MKPDKQNQTENAKPLPEAHGSAAEYMAADCLREEVARFKRSNRFTPMDVTGFYIQAAVVLDEHDAMVKALRVIRDQFGAHIGEHGEDLEQDPECFCARCIAVRSLPPNAPDERPEKLTNDL